MHYQAYLALRTPKVLHLMALQRAMLQARPSNMYLAPDLSCVLQHSWLWSSRRIRLQRRVVQSQVEGRKGAGNSVQHEIEYYKSVRGPGVERMINKRCMAKIWNRNDQNVLYLLIQ